MIDDADHATARQAQFAGDPAQASDDSDSDGMARWGDRILQVARDEHVAFWVELGDEQGMWFRLCGRR